MNPNLQNPEPITMKQVYAFGIFFAFVGTVICAMNHDLKFVILGAVCFGLNLYNYLHAEEKTGE